MYNNNPLEPKPPQYIPNESTKLSQKIREKEKELYLLIQSEKLIKAQEALAKVNANDKKKKLRLEIKVLKLEKEIKGK